MKRHTDWNDEPELFGEIYQALEDAGRIRIVDARYDTSSGKVSWF